MFKIAPVPPCSRAVTNAYTGHISKWCLYNTFEVSLQSLRARILALDLLGNSKLVTCRPGVSNWRPSSCSETTSPIMPLPVRVMLVTVSLAMPHGTCSFATAGGPPV